MEQLIEYALTIVATLIVGMVSYRVGCWIGSGQGQDPDNVRFAGELIAMFTGLLAFCVGTSLVSSRVAFLGATERFGRELEACRTLAHELATPPGTADTNAPAAVCRYLRLVATSEWPGLNSRNPHLAPETGVALEDLRSLVSQQDPVSARSASESLLTIESCRRFRLAEQTDVFPVARTALTGLLLAALCFFRGITPPNRYRMVLLGVSCIILGGCWALIMDADRPYSGLIRLRVDPVYETIESLEKPLAPTSSGAGQG